MKLKNIQREFFVITTIINEAENEAAIDAIARVHERIGNVVLLEVRRNLSRKQTSIVVAAHLESIQQYVQRTIKQAQQALDPDGISAESPTPGIIDSITIIPLLITNLPMAALLVNDVARKIATRFKMPIFYFGHNASDPQRQKLQYFRQFPHTAFKDPRAVPADLGNSFQKNPMGGILMGSRLYYLTFAIFLDSEEIHMVQEFLKAYTDYSGLTEAEKEIKNHALQKIKLRKMHILQHVKTMVGLLPDIDVIRVLCKIQDYQKAPLFSVYDLFDKSFKRLGIEIMGMQILGYIPMEPLVLSGRHYFKGKTLRLMDDLRFLTFALNHFRTDVVEPFDKDLQIIEWRINQLLKPGEESIVR